MRILIVSQYFWPESFIINQLSEILQKQGHHLVVLTGKPNYPDGDIYQGYERTGTQYENRSDIEIMRIPLRPRGKGGAKALALNYLSFIWSGLVHFPRLLKNREFDAILVFAPSPITSVIPAIPIKYLKKAHLAVWVQDLWPESLSATGFIKNKILLKLVEYIVRGIYAFSDTLLVQSKAFIEPVNKLSTGNKTVYFPNVIRDMNVIGDITNEDISEQLMAYLDSHFCFVFAGNIGKAQSIETLLAAAEKLRHHEQIRIVIVGSGSLLEWSQAEADKRGIQNVLFTGRYPIEVMPSIFEKAKALLVTLNAEQIFSYTIPSKIQAYMSAGKPIIASINGEAARVIQEAGAGLTCAAEDDQALAAQIQNFFNLKQQQRDEMAENSRQYFLQHFEIEQQCTKLVDILSDRIEQKRTGTE